MRIVLLAAVCAHASGACATSEIASDASVDDGGPVASIDGAPLDAACLAPPSPKLFEFSGQLETFVIPDCVTLITIEAFGAQGGAGVLPAATGGRGARVQSTFAVSPGDGMTVLVGEQGAVAVPFAVRNGQGGGTGGGGTFVVLGVSPVVIAGGGGGASGNDNPQVNIALPGGDGQAGENGQSGDGGSAGAGGVAGGGGTTGSNPGGFHVGTAGGGLSQAGQGVSDGNVGSFGTANGPAAAFLEGGAGGAAGSQGRAGAFGGGGAAGFTGGGGGGYSGGGTGSIFGAYGGGGGGSLNAGSDPVAETGVRNGSGAVLVSW